MFKFDPNAINELAEGIATFKIVAAVDTDQYGKPLLTKDGQNTMIKLTLNVKDDNGATGIMNDNLVSNAPWKVNQLLKAVNRSSWFKSGSLAPSQLINLQGQCILKKKEYNGKHYLNINSYVEMEKTESVNQHTSSIDELDDIPF